jgi:acyl-CoA reductase-like NAD-dependent aldehyde dehydrogenase
MGMSITTASPLQEIVARCRREQQAWARRPVAERLRPVRELRRLLVREHERLTDAVGRDLGKPPEETLAADVVPLADACKFLQQEAARLLRPRRVPSRLRPVWLMGQSDTVHHRARGVIGLIGTWNYPLLLNGVTLIQALTAGNGVVWKPSEVAPASAAVLHDLVQRAGYPPGLVGKLEATREAGKELAEADIDHVCFTGSSATGRALAGTLARRLVSSTLELSGCDALFVLEDADPLLAARAAWFGATINRGQTCLAVRRAFVHRGLYPPFLDALRPLVARAAPVRLALASQAEQARRLVRDAVAEGARLLEGPAAPAGNGDAQACVPQVVIDARPEMALCREASFAPIMAVLPFDTPDDALRMDAECPYGLGASVFTGRPERVEGFAARLRTGTVAVNDVIVSTAHPATPFGGRRESGWGVTQGAEGLLEMAVSQVVSVRGGTYRPHYDLAGPEAGAQAAMVRALLDYSHGTTLGQRLGGLARLLKAMWRAR